MPVDPAFDLLSNLLKAFLNVENIEQLPTERAGCISYRATFRYQDHRLFYENTLSEELIDQAARDHPTMACLAAGIERSLATCIGAPVGIIQTDGDGAPPAMDPDRPSAIELLRANVGRSRGRPGGFIFVDEVDVFPEPETPSTGIVEREPGYTVEELLFLCGNAGRMEALLRQLIDTNPTVARAWDSAKRARLSDTSAAELALLCLAREMEDRAATSAPPAANEPAAACPALGDAGDERTDGSADGFRG